jgi:hypothetical protein
MFSKEDLSRIRSLSQLVGLDRIFEEIHLQGLIEEQLKRLDLTVEEWIELIELSKNFSNKKDHLLGLLYTRAPTNEYAISLLEKLPHFVQEEAITNREIWSRILALESSDCKRFKKSPKEIWDRLSCLFFDNNKYGQKVSGLSLCPDYWQEAYNSGRFGNRNWFEVWTKSSKILPFTDWCEILGLNIQFAYYSDTERKSLEVNISKGKLLDTAGVLINTTNSGNFLTDCVMSLDETLYCYATSTLLKKKGLYHHSGILSGKPVLFAGEISVDNGTINKITTRSGHYKPSETHLSHFLWVLYKKGVQLDNVSLEDDSGRKISDNAQLYLENPWSDCASNRPSF